MCPTIRIGVAGTKEGLPQLPDGEFLPAFGLNDAELQFKAAVEKAGRLDFWRLAIKPGRPVAMGQIGATPLAGLPGNPVAALLTFALVARPMIEALSGTEPHIARRFRVMSAFDYRKKAGRREFVRVSLDRPDAGLAVATRFAKEGAGMLTSLTETDGLVELPENLTTLQKGAEVDFLPYSELM